MKNQAFQEQYPQEFSYCYGCGTQNEHGLQLKSYWNGEESIAHFTPKPYHIAIPGYVYGGLIASLIDCHGTGTAAAAAHKQWNQNTDNTHYPRYVTASLHVDYLKPTPLGCELKLIGRIQELTERKIIVNEELFAQNTLCAKGEVIAVKMPSSFEK